MLKVSSLYRSSQDVTKLRTTISRVLRSRYASTCSAAFKPRRSLTALGLVGGGSLVAAYFFWPDVSRSAPTYADVALSPAHFTPVTVTASEPCSDPNTRLMTLTVPQHLLPPLDGSVFAPIWSIFIKDDDIQVERPYTPLEGIDEAGRMKFWIKRYPRGEVGRWLHSKNVGETIEIRGPLRTWTWLEEGGWDEVVMVSGGTGITPFCQLLHSVLLSRAERQPSTHFTLLHSSRVPGELPPPELLQPLIKHASAHPESLSISWFVDTKDGSAAEAVARDEIRQGRIGQADIRRALGDGGESSWWQKLLRVTAKQPQLADRKLLVLVCGPETMINAIAGPYGRNYSQGPVGGILGELGLKPSQVWKL
ncbi:ferredoxin reductase-like C-terminal NADP-linked domain-containing protein [Trametopsis cervina]|nr:ferredoxin reductase-like C-terminal NADP-linked domain-containing protein [Trametopsis cervina]